MKKASEVGLMKKIKVVGEEGEEENGGEEEEEVAIGEGEERIGEEEGNEEEEAMIEDELREEGEVLLSGLVHHQHSHEIPFLCFQQAHLNMFYFRRVMINVTKRFDI